jgi:hypothetical protein
MNTEFVIDIARLIVPVTKLIIGTASMKRLVLLSVILQEGMSFAADNGRK